MGRREKGKFKIGDRESGGGCAGGSELSWHDRGRGRKTTGIERRGMVVVVVACFMRARMLASPALLFACFLVMDRVRLFHVALDDCRNSRGFSEKKKRC